MMATLLKPNQFIDHLRRSVLASAKITADTRQIALGDVFLAYSVGHGSALRDNRSFIGAALDAGATAVAYDPDGMAPDKLIEDPRCYAVADLAQFAGMICSEWYGNPSEKCSVIGVTGTNGKTSITQWLMQALDQPSERAAVMGTLGVGFPGQLQLMGYTTPDAPRLQTELKNLVDAGAKRIAMEVSSHALEQGRVNGVQFSTAVFSNLSQDHLDYHGTMADYAQAKACLFQKAGLRHAVINLEDAFGRELAMQLLAKQQIQVWGYALNPSAFVGFEKFAQRLNRVCASSMQFKDAGYRGLLEWQGHGTSELTIPVIGEFNLSNCLAVWACLLLEGVDLAEASKRIANVKPVSGRMEWVALPRTTKGSGPLVVVDYAHTPDALEKALQAVRPIATERGGRIWCVFGCGGDRDISKRPLMGHIASALADHIVITSDNPRSEDPVKIIDAVRSGIPNSVSVQAIVDRAAAIMSAVRHAHSADVILIAGKGHEATQEIKGKKFAFSDQEHVRLAAGGLV